MTLLPDAELSADPNVLRAVADLGIVATQAPFAATTAGYIEMAPGSFSVIILARYSSGGRHMEALRKRWPLARLVFHPGDLHSLREHRAATLSNNSAALASAEAIRQREPALIAGSDVTVVVSSYARTLLAEAGFGDRVVQVDPEYANRIPAPYHPAARSGVAFIGGVGHAPNVDAVHFLYTEVWPIIIARAESDQSGSYPAAVK